MSNRKLSIIITLVIVLLVGSGIVYYNAYNKAKSTISKDFHSSIPAVKPEASSTATTVLKPDIEYNLPYNYTSTSSTEDSKGAIEGQDYSYISYTVQKGDTLWHIAKLNMPDYVTKGVMKDIQDKNNLKTDTTVKLGEKLLVPKQK